MKKVIFALLTLGIFFVPEFGNSQIRKYDCDACSNNMMICCYRDTGDCFVIECGRGDNVADEQKVPELEMVYVKSGEVQKIEAKDQFQVNEKLTSYIVSDGLRFESETIDENGKVITYTLTKDRKLRLRI